MVIYELGFWIMKHYRRSDASVNKILSMFAHIRVLILASLNSHLICLGRTLDKNSMFNMSVALRIWTKMCV